MKRLYEMPGEGHSVRAIARELDLARNTDLKYLRSPEAMRRKSRLSRGSEVDTYRAYVARRCPRDWGNCVVLRRELLALDYEGGYSLLESYVSPRRRRRQPDTPMRFWADPGAQAQVGSGSLASLELLMMLLSRENVRLSAQGNCPLVWC